MKDLLQIQKKIRKTLEEWLTYCRNSLGIMEPEMYIMPDLPIRPKDTRFNENHSDFDKIAFYRRKSKSAENLTVRYDLFDDSPSMLMPQHAKNAPAASRMDTRRAEVEKKRPGRMMRSKSAFIRKFFSVIVNSSLKFT
jgi:hypothetical protein